ncbi:large subunit ribosomal protein L31 [Orenia metallireducens]|jgi:large subunit ribosomal protein L31|uniref:Large ribosomal subunit protein bL31 n=2 Tax=Orenia metallireducens TaxID=1413210 RepID=A0A1C0A6D6_9FIRM|nr:50S ribosomal protein L31 [Orenia metallireducens]OCL25666.1 50S ribosomal protein L31 [Orenia metallireducens]PRX35779.1 large subunit ribosomal protein L31 [Orenia metallireducens]SNY24028.1 large subunit ribosomal protein L31 [Orenia metallireducens]
MKKEIHPEYTDATITCACGEVFETKTTTGDMKVEICSNCHPFYTGKQKTSAKGGRIARFKEKYGIGE